MTPGVGAHGDELLERARPQLLDYLNGDRTSFDLSIVTNGNPFQERVWAILNEIPFGETTTYGHLTESLGCGRRSVTARPR